MCTECPARGAGAIRRAERGIEVILFQDPSLIFLYKAGATGAKGRFMSCKDSLCPTKR